MVTTLDVVDTGRRRRWTEAEKLRIVEQSLAGPRLVSSTARRHGITRSLLSTWRRLHAEGRLAGGDGWGPSFAPVMVAPEPLQAPAAVPEAPPAPEAGRVEIVLTNGRRIVVGAGVEAGALAQLIVVVERA